MRPFPSSHRHDPRNLPASHPLTALITKVEAAGGAVAAGPGTIPGTDARPVPTVLVELGADTFTRQAPTYRQAAVNMLDSLSERLT